MGPLCISAITFYLVDQFQQYRVDIAEEWDKLDQHIIDKAVEKWQKRLRACVAAGGGQFEHKM